MDTTLVLLEFAQPSFLPPIHNRLPQEEWAAESILYEHEVGRRGRKKQQLLVKWVGYPDPTWEPREALEDVAQLDVFDASRGRAIDDS